ncbi:START domain-containing protein [Alkalimarinus coralli]|uniref:START domain-containing protein n=1 Tax=Alkalimarinus coralli TaxID=2935863 RepID=UPI00202B4413|nr:START domain-containing protein [Alkalimarinus coralli]
MKRVHVISSLALAVVFSLASYSCVGADVVLDPNDPEWELQKDQDDIQVYFKDVEGSDIKAFMGQTVMSASVSSIVKVMKDERTCADWVQGCINAETLEGETFQEAFQYGVNDLPWPADDRDYVNHVSTIENAETGEISIFLDAVEGYVPESDNVRLKKMTIRYFLKPINQFETKITWVQHTEPGGNIPDWLVNMLLIDIPFYSLTRLEDVANKPDYRSAQFIYGKDRRITGVE